MKSINEAIKETNVNFCLDCGKCTSICPVALRKPDFTPRNMIGRIAHEPLENILYSDLIWDCLTCRSCRERCPADVYFSGFCKDIRIIAKGKGNKAECSHSGALQTLMRIMANTDLQQNRLDWLTDDLKISNNSEYLYFVGCIPYFDEFFTYLNLKSIETARSTVKLLNLMGIAPMVMKDERCCGHDLLWTGDKDNFEKLAKLNLNEIKKTDCKNILVSCPECYNTLKVDYKHYIKGGEINVIHITEFLNDNISKLEGKLKNFRSDKKVTYHDPCRLGRYSEIYEEPRNVLNVINKLKLLEMPNNRKSAVCCGTNAWSNCNSVSKKIQVDRLKEAKSTEAEILITACNKCEIHFKCALSDNDIQENSRIKIMDFVTLIASRIKK